MSDFAIPFPEHEGADDRLAPRERASPLQRMVDNAGPEEQLLFDHILEKTDQLNRTSLSSKHADLNTLLSLIENRNQPKDVVLLGAVLLQHLKSSNFVDDPARLEREIFAVFHAEKDPHRKHCLSIALQGCSPAAEANLLILLDREDGDYASVALRGSSSEEVTDRIKSLFFQTDSHKLFLRAVSALCGAEPERVEAVIGNPTYPHHMYAQNILSLPKSSAEDLLSMQLSMLFKTFPLSTDVIDSYDGNNPVAVLDERSGDLLTAQQQFTLGRVEGQFELYVAIPGVIETTEISPNEPFNSINVLKTAAQLLIEARHVQLSRAQGIVESTYGNFIGIMMQDDSRIHFSEELAAVPVDFNQLTRGDTNFRGNELGDCLRLLHETDVRRLSSKPGKDLNLGDLVEIIADSTQQRQTRYAASRLLNTARHTTELEEMVLDNCMLDILTGQYDDFTKHTAALVLQGTRREETLEALSHHFFHPEHGDFAAVSLRGSNEPIAIKTILRGIKSGERDIIERSALASLHTSDKRIGKALVVDSRMRETFSHSIFQALLSPTFRTPGIAKPLKKLRLGKVIESLAFDNRAEFAINYALNSWGNDTHPSANKGLIEIHRSLPIKSDLYKNAGSDLFVTGMGSPVHPFNTETQLGADRTPQTCFSFPAQNKETTLPYTDNLPLALLAHEVVDQLLDQS